LAYHKVSTAPSIYSINPDLFERQLRYLAENGYKTISLPYLAEALAGKTPLPSKAIVITFDDGYEDNYLTALPLMEKYGMRAAVFIAVNKVSQPGYMSWDQINAMQAKGLDIGSHSMSHPALTDISPSEQTKEILASKATLEKHLNRPVEFIAYPHGKFTPAMFNLLRQAGYRGAFSGISGLNFPGDNPYTLKRISILSPKFDIWSFQFHLIRTMISSKLRLAAYSFFWQ
jgi:Predicted xylanase/chitin deacetylase